MDKPINKGDLVVVVRASFCCSSDVALGYTYIVSEIRHEMRKCIYCGSIVDGVSAMSGEGRFAGMSCLLSRLKRIPPLSESEDVQTKEEIHV